MMPKIVRILGLLLAALPAWGQGFPNVAYPPAMEGALLSGIHAPTQGRTALVAYHNGILYTVPESPSSHGTPEFPADVQARSWDISDPSNPQVLELLGPTRHPISAHGYFFAGDTLLLGDNLATPETSWAFTATNTFGVNSRGAWADMPGGSDGGIGDRGRLYHPFHINMWWSYGPVGGNAVLSRLGGFNNSNQPLASWDHLGDTGVIGHPFIVGNLLIIASEDSRTGVATYDISDPSAPLPLDVLTSGGPGGYWPELWGGDGKLYVVWPYRTFGRGMRVADITDPSDIRWVIDLPLPGDEPMYVQFQDEFAFLGSHKVNMNTLTSVLSFDTDNAVHTVPNNPFVPEGVGVNMTEFALPLGNLLVTGGDGFRQGMCIWVHDDAPDTRGPEVGFHIPRAGQTNYPLDLPISLLIHETLDMRTLVNGDTFVVRAIDPVVGPPIDGHVIFAFNDTLTFTPYAPLQPETTYEVSLTPGGLMDVSGNPTIGYSFTFSTGSNVAGNSAPEISSFDASVALAAPGAEITFTAVATDVDPGDEAGLLYRFDAGDGRPKSLWTSAASVAYSYAEPGHYRASVQVRDPANSSATDSVNVSVLVAPVGPSPTQSCSLALAADGDVWVVNPDHDSIARIDATTSGLELEVPVCGDPRSLAVDGDGNVWVTCHDADRIEVRSGGDGTLLAAVDTGYGSAPFGLALSPDGASAFVSLYGSGRLLRIDVASRAIDAGVDLGPTARAVAVSGDGMRVLVTRFITPRNLGEVWEVDPATMTLTRTLQLPKLGGLAHQDNTAEGRGIANYLAGVSIAPDGASAWVVGNKPNIERGERFGVALDADNTVRNLAMRIDLASGEVDRTMDLDNSDSASAVAFSPLGDYLFITLQGNNDVLVFDALTLNRSTGLGGIVTRLPVGLAPQGVAVDATTGRILVQNFLGRSLSVIDGEPLFTEREISLSTTTAATSSSEALPLAVLRGKRIFYNAADSRMSAEGYLSCATCHIDGSSDGRVWDFTQRGEGLRNTTELRGRAGMGQGNVHWSGNFDEIQDFENDIRGGFGGSGFLEDDDFLLTQEPLGQSKAGLSQELDDLAAYLASLETESLPRSPYRAADGTLTEDGLAGRDLFVQAGCQSCHNGAAFTDSVGPVALLHDVGTLRSSSGQRLGGSLEGIDTPTLLGVWANAPYFHDGSAKTLNDVFTVARGTILEAEDGAVTAGSIQVGASNLLANFDNSVSGGLVEVNHQGVLILEDVDGGMGGVGAVEFRYSVNAAAPMAFVRVNGAEHPVQLYGTGNNPSLSLWGWDTARVEGVLLEAGTNNTIELGLVFGGLAIDHVTISTPADLQAALAHRSLLELPTQAQTQVQAFVQQLDGTAVTMPAGTAPTATLSLSPGQIEPVDAEFIDFDVTLSRHVEGFEATDVSLGGEAGGVVVGVSEVEPGLVFRVHVGGLAQAGTLTLQLRSASVTALDDGAPNLLSLPVAAAVVPADDLAPLSDEFDDAATVSDWQRNYLAEGWGADKLEAWDIDTSTDGHMRLMPYSSTWFNDYTGALVFKEVTGDFVATIRLDVGRRNGQAGRPQSDYSWSGLLVRAPRGLTQAAPNPDPGPNTVLPWPPPAEGQLNHYTTEWQPGTENYIYLASGFATNAINGDTNVWQYEAKTTIDGDSDFYSSANGTGVGEDVSTLQIVRRGQTFVLLRRHGDGAWIIENRYVLPEMPATLQVGMTAYGDWNYAGTLNEFHHNRTAAIGVGNSDIVADVDYFRLRRPAAEISEAGLQGLLLTGQYGALQLLSATAYEQFLGDAANATATPTPTATPPHSLSPTPTVTPTPTATPTATSTPTPAAGCPEVMRLDCTAATKAKISVRDGEGRRRSFDWRWDGPSSMFDFGTPTLAGEEWTLCTYIDGTLASAASLPTGLTCGSRPCWSPLGDAGVQFRDDDAHNDGFVRLQVRPRGDQLRLAAKGRGPNVQSPLPIAPEEAVTVQFGRPAGVCWESGFEPSEKEGRADRYRARFHIR